MTLEVVHLYQVLSELSTSDAGDDDPRLEEAADIMAGLAEQAYAAGDTSFSRKRPTTTCRSTCWTRWETSTTTG